MHFFGAAGPLFSNIQHSDFDLTLEFLFFVFLQRLYFCLLYTSDAADE